MTFQQKLRKFSKQQLWNEYCGYLELNIKEYMYIQRRLMQEQINSWGASDSAGTYTKIPRPRA